MSVSFMVRDAIFYITYLVLIATGCFYIASRESLIQMEPPSFEDQMVLFSSTEILDTYGYYPTETLCRRPEIFRVLNEDSNQLNNGGDLFKYPSRSFGPANANTILLDTLTGKQYLILRGCGARAKCFDQIVILVELEENGRIFALLRNVVYQTELIKAPLVDGGSREKRILEWINNDQNIIFPVHENTYKDNLSRKRLIDECRQIDATDFVEN